MNAFWVCVSFDDHKMEGFASNIHKNIDWKFPSNSDIFRITCVSIETPTDKPNPMYVFRNKTGKFIVEYPSVTLCLAHNLPHIYCFWYDGIATHIALISKDIGATRLMTRVLIDDLNTLFVSWYGDSFDRNAAADFGKLLDNVPDTCWHGFDISLKFAITSMNEIIYPFSHFIDCTV